MVNERGNCLILLFFSRLFQLLGGVRAWPSVWRLAPDMQSSELLDLAAIDMTVVVVN